MREVLLRLVPPELCASVQMDFAVRKHRNARHIAVSKLRAQALFLPANMRCEASGRTKWTVRFRPSAVLLHNSLAACSYF